MQVMKNRIINSISAFFLAVILFASCERKTEWTSFEKTYEQPLGQSESAGRVRVKHVVDYYKSLAAGKSVRIQANNTIVKFLFGDACDGKPIEDASEIYVDTFYRSIVKNIESGFYDEVDYVMYGWYDNTEGHFGDSYGDYQNYNVTYENYLGGAHGMYGIHTHIINVKTGLAVIENEIFRPGYVQPVTDLIKDAIQKMLCDDENDPTSVLSVMFQENILPNGNCGVSTEGIYWNYNPYEIDCFSAGIITVTVPWDSLKPYINPEVFSL